MACFKYHRTEKRQVLSRREDPKRNDEPKYLRFLERIRGGAPNTARSAHRTEPSLLIIADMEVEEFALP